MKSIRVRYYAILREQAGTSGEELSTDAGTAAALYAEIAARHGFTLPRSLMKVAVNGEFASWDAPLSPDDEVVFIPPVAGG